VELSRTCRTVLIGGLLLSTVGTGPPAAADEKGGGTAGPVIVVLRDQVRQAGQATLRDRAEQAGGTEVRGLRVINAFSAQLTTAQADRLAADPSVAAVVPDRKVPVAAPAATAGPAAGTSPRAAAAGPAPVLPGTCPTDPARPLLEPEGLQATRTASADPARPQAQRLADGAGVRVAWIADGLDPANPDFVRADGSSVFADYRDFSGTDPAAGGEAERRSAPPARSRPRAGRRTTCPLWSTRRTRCRPAARSGSAGWRRARRWSA
jgi:Peptidase inhibitor I9